MNDLKTFKLEVIFTLVAGMGIALILTAQLDYERNIRKTPAPANFSPSTIVNDPAMNVKCTLFDSGCVQCEPINYAYGAPQEQVRENGTVLDVERGMYCWRSRDDVCYNCVPLPGTTNLPDVRTPESWKVTK